MNLTVSISHPTKLRRLGDTTWLHHGGAWHHGGRVSDPAERAVLDELRSIPGMRRIVLASGVITLALDTPRGDAAHAATLIRLFGAVRVLYPDVPFGQEMGGFGVEVRM